MWTGVAPSVYSLTAPPLALSCLTLSLTRPWLPFSYFLSRGCCKLSLPPSDTWFPHSWTQPPSKLIGSSPTFFLFIFPIQGHRAAPTTLPRSPEPLTTVLWSECSLFWSWLLYSQILIALWNTMAFPHMDIIRYYDHTPFFLFPVLIISFLFPTDPFVFFILNDSVSFIRVAFQDYEHLPSLFTSELYSASLPGRGGASAPTPTSYCGLNGLSLIVASSVSLVTWNLLNLLPAL